ncbi:MAG: twin-arginine translocase TatA/TatE family subunit [Bacteroidales bacterium]|jgi:sec-independent protein translocase protein TatA|nr:twin-arginine translocase TatA/TatE family subunit [Bacteroidales bacterium]
MGHLLFISGQEIFLIVLAVLVLFGADKMPELLRGFGKGMREFRKAADDVRREIETGTSDLKKDIGKMTDEIKKDLTG